MQPIYILLLIVIVCGIAAFAFIVWCDVEQDKKRLQDTQEQFRILNVKLKKLNCELSEIYDTVSRR